jgi:hypothetical protein
MQENILHEVAALLHVNHESRLGCPENDDHYNRYVRLLRHYYRIAWRTHTCWSCNKTIFDFYEAWVYIAKPGIFVEKLGRVATLWVVKRHYPECPDRLHDYKKEMEAAWEERQDQRAIDSEERRRA